MQRVATLSASELVDGIAGATGIGNVGTGLEWILAYPVVALVALNLAYRRLDQRVSPCTEK